MALFKILKATLHHKFTVWTVHMLHNIQMVHEVDGSCIGSLGALLFWRLKVQVGSQQINGFLENVPLLSLSKIKHVSFIW